MQENKTNNNFNLKDLSLDEINLIIEGLSELPLKKSIYLYIKIKNQIEDLIKKNNIILNENK